MNRDDAPSGTALADHYAAQNLSAPAAMDAFWMPFTANRQFRQSPRLLASAVEMVSRSLLWYAAP